MRLVQHVGAELKIQVIDGLMKTSEALRIHQFTQ